MRTVSNIFSLLIANLVRLHTLYTDARTLRAFIDSHLQKLLTMSVPEFWNEP